MIINIQAEKKDALMKCCLELGFTCVFHDVDKEIKPVMVNAYIADYKLGELTTKSAFYLGMAFRGELDTEIIKSFSTV